MRCPPAGLGNNRETATGSERLGCGAWRLPALQISSTSHASHPSHETVVSQDDGEPSFSPAVIPRTVLYVHTTYSVQAWDVGHVLMFDTPAPCCTALEGGETRDTRKVSQSENQKKTCKAWRSRDCHGLQSWLHSNKQYAQPQGRVSRHGHEVVVSRAVARMVPYV
jgi:hypothetical protein